MLTTVFSPFGENRLEQLEAIKLNVQLIRRLDPKRHISLLVRSAEGLDDLECFDRVYEIDWGNNDISFLARTLPMIEADQVLYLTPRLFCMNALTRAFERNLQDGVFFPSNPLDFRGVEIDATEAWQVQQLLSKHQWPAMCPSLMLYNRDDKSRQFFEALDLFATHWDSIGKEHSDGAITDITWDHLISFTCLTHPELYRQTHLLDFRCMARRDSATDKNWINRKWNEWLDTWWVTKDGLYLRVENVRQQGFIELADDCLDDIRRWLS